MTIAVTGATGHLGRQVVESLLDRGVPAEEIVALGRSTERIADLAERGVQVRYADYDEPAGLPQALDGVDRLLLVSGSEVGRRLPQHRAVIDAAIAAGVELLAYTSAPNADTGSYIIAQEHRVTEELLAASGLPVVVLRNGWYLDGYLAQLPTYLEHGVVGAAGEGRIAAALRAELAEAAAVAISTDGHEGRTYSLGGPGFTLAELAAAVAEASGRDVTYTDLPADELTAVLTQAGIPQEFAAVIADADVAAARGELYVEPDDLEKLLGRPATTYAEAVREAL